MLSGTVSAHPKIPAYEDRGRNNVTYERKLARLVIESTLGRQITSFREGDFLTPDDVLM